MLLDPSYGLEQTCYLISDGFAAPLVHLCRDGIGTGSFPTGHQLEQTCYLISDGFAVPLVHLCRDGIGTGSFPTGHQLDRFAHLFIRKRRSYGRRVIVSSLIAAERLSTLLKYSAHHSRICFLCASRVVCPH